jgi:hypothetical protein
VQKHDRHAVADGFDIEFVTVANGKIGAVKIGGVVLHLGGDDDIVLRFLTVVGRVM